MPRPAAQIAALIAALAATAPAFAQDVEMSCIDALSSELGVPMNAVDVRNQRDMPGGGTAVHVIVNHAPYTCEVDPSGRVTAVERGSAD